MKPYVRLTTEDFMQRNKIEFAVGGMHCAACSARIERVLGNMPEVAEVSVNLPLGRAVVVPAPGVEQAALIPEIVQTVERLGFTARPEEAGGDAASAAARWEAHQKEEDAELADRRRDLAPALICTLLLLYLAMGEMIGLPGPAPLSPAAHPARFALAQLLLCLPVLWSGRRFYLRGLPALFRKSPNMDTLVALGTGAAFLFSFWNTLAELVPGWAPLGDGSSAVLMEHMGRAEAWASGEGILAALFGAGHAAHGPELYYESAAVVIALVSLGKYLEIRSRRRASEALKSLLDLTPETALLLAGPDENAARKEVPVAALAPGDTVLVRPGGRVPVDGMVLSGSSHVDESMLSGESMPVTKNPGDPLAGGTINQNSALVMRVERVGADTVLARIVRLVQEAQAAKAPIAGLADQVSLWFVPAVIACALPAGLFWWWYGQDVAFALRVLVGVLVIACPCAMGLATPMAIMVGTGRGAQLGVLFKNGTALEHAARLTVMVFDKTGTLTEGRPAVTDLVLLDAEARPKPTANPGTALQLAASLENASEHPLARAVLRRAEEAGLTAPAPIEFTALPGRGVAGLVPLASGPVQAVIGNLALARERLAGNEAVIARLEETAGALAAQAKTPIVLLCEDRPLALLAVADPIRPEAPAVLRRLEALQITPVMLSGDNEATARAVAGSLGISRVTAEVLPDQKESVIRILQAKGEVVGMVGDGINDAPALARADVGMAVAEGIDVAVETGDVVLMRKGLEALPDALGLSRAVLRNIRQNLFWAFGYNIVGIPFAAGVFFYFGGPALSPMLAGAAMALSSVSVVSNALRLRFYRG